MTVNYELIRLYPTFLKELSNNYSATSNSITIRTQVDKVGNAYCSAVETTRSKTDIKSVRTFQNPFPIVRPFGNVTITISNLMPSTMYTVLCYTSSFHGQQMPIEEMVKYGTVVHTGCCKRLSVQQSYDSIIQYIDGNSADEKQFIVALSSFPNSLISINISLQAIDCLTKSPNGLSSIATALPSSKAFGPNSTSLVFPFVIRCPVTSCFIVTAISTGMDEYYSTNFTTKVRNYRVPPSVPKIKSAIFSNDGVSFNIEFSASTDQAQKRILNYDQSFNCSKLLEFPEALQADCKWFNDFTLVVTPSAAAIQQVSLNQIIWLKANMIRAKCELGSDCENYLFMNRVNVTLLASNSPLKPVALLFSANFISPCDDMLLDATASYGHGSRSWKEINWLVEFEPSGVEAYDITLFLNQHFASNTSTIARIPNAMLQQGAVYFVRLFVTNFFGQIDVTGIYVTVRLLDVNSNNPQVRIYGVQREYFAWEQVLLSSIVQYPSCYFNQSLITPIYTWKMYIGFDYIPNFMSVSKDSKLFQLDRYTLQPSTLYRVVLEVTYGNVAIKANVVVNTARSSPVAIIKGGSMKTAGSNEVIELDGSSSYDQDFPRYKSSLLFTWSCIQMKPSFGASCPLIFATNATVISASPGVFAAGTYNISLKVETLDGESSSTSILLTILTRNAPFLRVQNVKSKYNVEDKIILSGVVVANSTSAVRLIWSSLSLASFSTTGKAITPLSKDLSLNGTTKAALFQLAIAPHSLLPGQVYLFRLQAQYILSMTAFATATIEVQTNSPPINGITLINPSQGEAFSTVFSISAILWSDDLEDYPFTYSFAYSQQLQASGYSFVKINSPMNYISTVLGQGLMNLEYQLLCTAFVSDIYGGANNASSVVNVYPLANITEVFSFSNQAMQQAVLNKDPSSLLQSIGTSLTSFNAVNCTRVPSLFCKRLNRMNCQYTSNTCGSCLSGFVGLR